MITFACKLAVLFGRSTCRKIVCALPFQYLLCSSRQAILFYKRAKNDHF